MEVNQGHNLSLPNSSPFPENAHFPYSPKYTKIWIIFTFHTYFKDDTVASIQTAEENEYYWEIDTRT